jgi:putative SOS response-associated peptidase YedK
MCNLYSIVRPRDEKARAFRVLIDQTANQPPLPAVFPDQLAPIVRINSAGERIMESMRWGFPPPPNVTGRPVTNVRNTSSAYWRSWLGPRFRCLVPATSYCEYHAGSKVPTWFARVRSARSSPSPGSGGRGQGCGRRTQGSTNCLPS